MQPCRRSDAWQGLYHGGGPHSDWFLSSPAVLEERWRCGKAGFKMNASKAQELQETSMWDTLSLEEALTSMERMPHLPSVQRLIDIVHKCRTDKNIGCIKRLHAYICKNGLEDYRSLGNYLIQILVLVGSMCDAQQVFNRLVDRSVHSWTSLIRGFIERGEAKHALNLYQKMREDSVHPSKYTFVALLKACARLKDLERGEEIHAEISTKGLERDLFIGSTLLDMYAKCGLLTKAQTIFDKLPVRDVVSWTALIAGYAEHGPSQEALNCFEQMQLEGVSPNAITFVCSLKACGSIGAIDKGRKIYSEIARKGLEKEIFVGNTLVDMYAKCGSFAKAWEAFDKLPDQDVVSWNALVAGYARHGLGEEVVDCFQQMQLNRVSPNAVTFVCSLKACGSIGAIDKGREIHAEVSRKGLERDLFVGNTLLDMYAKCGLLGKAREVFDKLKVRDVVSWTALITGYSDQGLGEEALNCFGQMELEGVLPNAVTFVCSLKACGSIGAVGKGQEIYAEIARNGLERDLTVGNILVDTYAKCGLLAKAREVFDKVEVRNEVSWTALIAGYAECGLGEEALKCFGQMQLEGVTPNAVTFVCSLKACGSIGTVDKGREIHSEIARNGLEMDLIVGNTLLDMYAKCGSLAEAREAFDKLPVRDEVSWNALIAGYAQLGESETVFLMVDKMREEGIEPRGVTFLIVFNVCSHTGLVDKARKYFEAMSKDYGIPPTAVHQACMVDLLGRAGQLDEAIAMVKSMPFHPNLVVWHKVLGASRKWGNVELGRLAFEHAVQLDESDAAAYVFMANIYADAHMLEEEVEAMSVNK